jgi:CcmD family protein
MTMTKPLLLSLLLFGLFCGVTASAAAQTTATPGEYHSPLRATWRDEVRRDPGLKADIEGALREAVHVRESETFTRNNRHVVLAYAMIWVLTVGFVAFLWLRQVGLNQEIARLRAELARAARDEGA